MDGSFFFFFFGHTALCFELFIFASHREKTLDIRVLSFYLVIECLIVPVRACWSFVTFTVGLGISME